ncbi:ABC transporter substrate-binding protein [Anaerobacterium chartisolvens]|uniref:ABC transporter substrate-binding protein n=1 Tax=Anaerobacterium chartisolvens TaxID=1297424 RepID=UPI0014743608|nr:extracellular solute-binding protein [Anaerobacterium chartisolvens]
MIRTVTSVVLCSVLIASFAGCGNTSSSGGTQTTASTDASVSTDSVSTDTEKKEPITLTFSTFNNWGTAQNAVSIGISLYEKGTGNKVEQQLYPDDQFMNVIKTKLATGDVPDFIATYASRKGNVPLDLLEPLDGEEWITQIRPGLDSFCTRESDGKWVVAPVGALSYLGAIYNKDVFKKAGVSLPLKNYEDLLAACEAIQKIGVAPIQPANKDNAAFIWDLIGDHYLYEKNPDIAKNIAANKLNPSESPEINAAYQRIVDLKKYFKSDYASATGMDGLKQVANGEVAMFANGSWCYGILSKDYADKMPSLGIMPISLGDDYQAVTRTGPQNGFAIPKKSKHINEAKEFIKYVMTPVVAGAVAEVAPGTYPLNVDTRKSSWDSEMEGYVEQGLPTKNQTMDEYFGSFDVGPGFQDSVQTMLLGKPIKSALNEEWYKKMADLNKSKRTPGW